MALYVFKKEKTKTKTKKDLIIVGGSCVIVVSSFPSFMFCLDANKSLWYFKPTSPFVATGQYGAGELECL